MNFQAAGVFKLLRQDNGHIDVRPKSRTQFWEIVEAEAPGLKNAAGCYVFVMFNSRSALPWYVGKAELQSFEREIFSLHKVHHYNEVVASNKGTPYVFLIPRRTSRGAFCKPTKVKNESIRLLETLLIGMALRRNPQLRNVRDTSTLRKLRIEGVLNSKVQGRLGNAPMHLKRALRIN